MAVISILSISWSVAKAIKNAKDCILQIAAGDLNIEVDNATKERNDEIGQIGNALCELSEKLKEIILEIMKSDGEETLYIIQVLDESNSRTNRAVEKIDQQKMEEDLLTLRRKSGNWHPSPASS